MISILKLLLIFFLTTAGGVTFFSTLDRNQQDSVKNWISGIGSLEPRSYDDDDDIPSTPAQAPEIDAASGTSAITLLTGVLLLAGERSRSRRS